MKKRFDLHEKFNANCQGKCDKATRQEKTEDDLCTETVSVIDGLSIRCVGEHAYEKIYFLRRYYEIFLNGQKNNWQGKLAYFEIGSGPGRCIERQTKMEIDGTSLAILASEATEQLKCALFFDINPTIVQTLNSRIKSLGKESKAHALVGDYNDGQLLATEIARLNAEGLNLVFIDPTDCSIPFSSIAEIKRQVSRVDFIINVASMTDFNRNIPTAVFSPHSDVRRKYEAFLGTNAFFSRPELSGLVTAKRFDDVRQLFFDTYRTQLAGIGLFHWDLIPIEHYYHLAFASAHPTGLDFWHKAVRGIQHNGQRELGFDFPSGARGDIVTL